MVMMPYECSIRGRHKIRVYSEAQGELMKVFKGEVQQARQGPESAFTLSNESEMKLVSLLKNEDTDMMTLICVIKYFLQRYDFQAETMNMMQAQVQSSVIAALSALKSRLGETES